MAYVYLLDLYKYIDERLDDATDGFNKTDGDEPTGKFEQGRIDTLTELKEFLKVNFNPKLPKRIRETYFGRNEQIELE